MDKKEYYEKIQQVVLPKLETLRAKGTVEINVDEKYVVRDLYTELLPYAQINLSCDKCIIHYMNMLLSNYEREYPLYVKENEVINEGENSPVPTNNRRTKRRSASR